MSALLNTLLKAAVPATCLFQAVSGSLLDPFSPGILQKRQMLDDDWDISWAQFEPARTINWQHCYDGRLDCARLEVPMHHDDCSSNKTVTIAIVRLNATNTADYQGPILFNPGGPGGSGVFQLAQAPQMLVNRLNGSHDIISWDTRGLFRSTPRVECWANRQRRAIWHQVQRQDMYSADFMDGPAWIAHMLARWRAETNVCKDMMEDSELLPTLSTATHARDMDSIRKALGLEKIRYWGFSWGTALGGYYATMFPDRIERFVSEGNVDLRRWVSNDRSHDLSDVPFTWNHILEQCAADESCPLHEPTGEAVQARFDRLEETLRQDPRIHFRGGRNLPEVAQPNTITSLALQAVQTVFLGHLTPFIMNMLAALEKGDAPTNEHEVDPSISVDPYLSSTTPVDRNDADSWTSRLLLSDYFTTCMDRPPGPDDPEELFELYQEARNRTVVGNLDILRHIECTGNIMRPKNPFYGPFGANTSFPILFINAWDSQTPRSGATRNSELFPGSKVLFLDEHGHESTLVSPCVHHHVWAYLKDGSLPDGEETCEGIEVPGFPGGELLEDVTKDMMWTGLGLADLVGY